MAAHTKESKLSPRETTKKAHAADASRSPQEKGEKHFLRQDHLPPLPLVLVVTLCSLSLLVFPLRDYLSTGKNIGGAWDEALLTFTKSTDWFNDAKGWKSTQGGFSAIMKVSTDQNNMGGFFVRKLAGAAAIGVHLQKLLPLLHHPTDAQWSTGDFIPLMLVALIGDACIALFYVSYWKDLMDAEAEKLPLAFLVLLTTESVALLGYLLLSRPSKRRYAIKMPRGKTPKSMPSNIVARTIMIVSTAMFAIAARDFVFPGHAIDLIPRDDIYLEWTNAFIHSPPDGSPEAYDHGLEAPLYVGDKFISQFMALHIMILCLYKFTSSCIIRLGPDGSGLIKSRMIWQGQAVAAALMLIVVRLFQPAANSASLDLRWHLMCLGYETFILFLFGFF